MTACAGCRSAIQDRLDGPLPAERASEIDAHLSACPACREYRDELATVVRALRELPAAPFPDRSFEEMLLRTSRAPKRRLPIRIDWRIAAAAAIVTVALLPSLFRPVPKGPSALEIARARDEVRLVLGLAGRAIRETEKARDQLLNGEIAPAFRRVPLRRPAPDTPDTQDTRRSRS